LNLYEREYFSSRIRSGIHRLKLDNGVRLTILSPTAEEYMISGEIYDESFWKARADNIMLESEMQEWMKEKGLWTEEDDEKIEQLDKNLEKLKVQIFQQRLDRKMVQTLRAYIKATKKELSKMRERKSGQMEHTCEGIALTEKGLWVFENCSYIGSQKLAETEIETNGPYFKWMKSILDDDQVREIAKTDPFRLYWNMKDVDPIFKNRDNRNLTNEQMGVILWSRMYDGVRESMDCPSEDVIEDDDMLDGWFIVQRKKHEAEKAKSELESRTNNEKIAQSPEVMVFTGRDKKAAESVHSMNDMGSEIVRKQRLQTVKNKGGATDLDFQDKRLEIANQQREMFKNSRR
tara:strand:+ start:289 stop:1329 length:1041 start_codon:yes stop_codon:yes gene_type:complete